MRAFAMWIVTRYKTVLYKLVSQLIKRQMKSRKNKRTASAEKLILIVLARCTGILRIRRGGLTLHDTQQLINLPISGDYSAQ